MYSIGVEPISNCATFLLCLSLLCCSSCACGEATGYECSTATSDDSTNNAASGNLVADLPRGMAEDALCSFVRLQSVVLRSFERLYCAVLEAASAGL